MKKKPVMPSALATEKGEGGKRKGAFRFVKVTSARWEEKKSWGFSSRSPCESQTSRDGPGYVPPGFLV